MVIGYGVSDLINLNITEPQSITWKRFNQEWKVMKVRYNPVNVKGNL